MYFIFFSSIPLTLVCLLPTSQIPFPSPLVIFPLWLGFFRVLQEQGEGLYHQWLHHWRNVQCLGGYICKIVFGIQETDTITLQMCCSRRRAGEGLGGEVRW